MRIGIDFDNTIAGYDSVFRQVAVEWGLLPEAIAEDKRRVKELILLRPEGALEWQRLQGKVYGKYMPYASPMDGVKRFVRRCRERGVQVAVVSHKTEFGHFDEERVNLRQAAMAWMEDQGFFMPNDIGLVRESVYFENTRREKVERIAQLACDWFVDDLPEVFAESTFPESVNCILFSPSSLEPDPSAPSTARFNGIRVATSWAGIEKLVFR
ncbi:HAD family hydrolase [Endothiovibrio diazotrophicus]